jgi:hypothetical protein
VGGFHDVHSDTVFGLVTKALITATTLTLDVSPEPAVDTGRPLAAHDLPGPNRLRFGPSDRRANWALSARDVG